MSIFDLIGPDNSIFPGSGGIGPTNPFTGLPTLGSPLTAVYSARLLVNGYAGALFRLVRASDSATMDIFPKSDGTLDIPTITTWIGGSSATVDRVYDQKGSGNNLTQTTAANRPLFIVNPVGSPPDYGITFYSSNATLFFTLPSAITGDGKNCSICNVVSARATTPSLISLEGATFSTAGSITIYSGSQDYHANTQLNLSGTNRSVTNARFRSQTQVTTIVSGASNVSVYTDSTPVQTVTANTAGTWAGGQIGSIGSGSVGFNGTFFAHIIYSGALSGADVTALHNSLYNAFTGNLVTAVPAVNSKFVFVGHSAVYSLAATDNFTVQYYLEKLLNKKCFIICHGIPGQTAATAFGARAVYSAEFDATKGANISVACDVANDLAQVAAGSIVGFGTTLYNTYTLPFIQFMQAAGFTMMAQTMLPYPFADNFAARETERLAYNTLVINNAVTDNYGLLDFANNVHLSDNTNHTYYAPDNTHLIDAGIQVEAGMQATVMNPYLL